MVISRKSFRQASYITLALSVIGMFLVCMSIVGPQNTLKIAASCSTQIAIGYVVMIFVIELFGGLICSFRACRVTAGIFGFILFIVGVLLGSASSMILYGTVDVRSYIVKPLFWLGVYGFIPAIITGLIGYEILRRLERGEQRMTGADTTRGT